MFRLALPTLRAAAPVSRRTFVASAASSDLKSAADQLNHAAGNALKTGIETVESATEAVKETVNSVTGQAKAAANETANEAGSSDLATEAKKVGADLEGGAIKGAVDVRKTAKKVGAELNRE